MPKLTADDVDWFLFNVDERLHNYQNRAVRHLLENPKAGLFLEMGLGKTATTLQALTPDHLPALVIAPKRVAEHVWEPEVRQWRPDLSVGISAGTPKARQKVREEDNDITVISRDNIKDITEINGYKTVIFDELSGFKSQKSQRWKHAKKITKKTPFVWGLTGTPSPNGLMDLWAQVFLLDRGARLEDGITKFRSKYFTPGRQLPNGTIIEWKLKPGSEDAIQEKISDICLSMRSEDYLELPSVTHNVINVPIGSRAWSAYYDIRDSLATEQGEHDYLATNAAVASNKLSQICAGFLYPDADAEDGVPTVEFSLERIHAVNEIVEGTGSPVLVFYRFKTERDRLLRGVEGSRLITEPGVVDAWNRGEIPVLIAHAASAGHGLNLQEGGHTIVWTSLPWSLELYEQANARLDRQGQKNPVVIHHLVTPGTVDERIMEALENKGSVQDALMQYLTSCKV